MQAGNWPLIATRKMSAEEELEANGRSLDVQVPRWARGGQAENTGAGDVTNKLSDPGRRCRGTSNGGVGGVPRREVRVMQSAGTSKENPQDNDDVQARP